MDLLLDEDGAGRRTQRASGAVTHPKLQQRRVVEAEPPHIPLAAQPVLERRGVGIKAKKPGQRLGDNCCNKSGVGFPFDMDL